MLQLTPAAASLLGGAIRARRLPASAGVRVSGARRGDGRLELGLDLAAAPEAGDNVTERDGTRLFIAPEISDDLSSATLDVQRTDAGTRLTITTPPDVTQT